MTMKEQLSKMQASFIKFWEAQDKKRRIIYIITLVLIVLIAIVVGILLNRKDYVVLYEGLETSEATEMVSAINGLGYEATLTGGKITVPAGTENTLTMQMAQQGYPKSNLNYDMYTTYVDMFSSESQKEEYARIALEQRLGAIISSLECVDKAIVSLSIPTESNTVITTLKKYPTANVTVTLVGAEKLSNEQITGITNIIMNAHSGLTAEHISIVDSFGLPQIIGEEEIDVVADMTRKLRYKTELEHSIQDKILSLLQPSYGIDGVSAQVNMVLNYDSKVSETTDYSADGDNNTGVLHESGGADASGGTVVDGGIIGVDPNADDTYPTGNIGGNEGWTESEFSNLYLVDMYKEQVQKDGYSIDGLSVAVVVYTDYLSPATKDELVNLAANAAGVDPLVAVDLVTVTSLLPFEDKFETEEEVPVYLFGLTFNQLVLAAVILLILIIILIVALIIASKNSSNKRRVFEQQILESSAFGGDDDDIIDSFTIDVNGQRVEIASLADEAADTKEVVIRREIAEFAKNSPEIVAQLLKSWIKEDEE